MQVRKLITRQVLLGIKNRIQAGNVQKRFNADLADIGAIDLFGMATREAGTQLRVLERTVDSVLAARDSWFDQQVATFDQTYGALLPQGALKGYAETKTRELELGLMSFAMAMQEFLMASPEAVTAVIDIGNFSKLLQNTLQRIFDAAKELKLTSLTDVLPQAVVESRQLVKEDWPKVPNFLQQAKVEEKNIYEWLEAWRESCFAFEASPEERQNLSLNTLAEVFYGEIKEELDAD